MCGRYVLGADASDYAEFLRADRLVTESLGPSYNVAPTDPVYAAAEWNGERLLGTMRWGLIPHWTDDLKGGLINARSETVATKPSFRDAFARRRCLLPADGFYEWEPAEQSRTPHWVYRVDGQPMVFAGIWTTHTNPNTGEKLRTCAIITAPARGAVQPIHDRMPVALDERIWDAWLDRDLTDPEEALALLQPIDPDLLMEHPVSGRVNSVRNNSPDLTAPEGQPRLI